MPRTTQEIIDHAEQLARKFEEYDPNPDDVNDAGELRTLRQAVLTRAEAERYVADAVTAARRAGHAWSAVGAMLGTSGEAARQRYGESPRRNAA